MSKILNPKTGRFITYGGVLHKQLIRDNVIKDNVIKSKPVAISHTPRSRGGSRKVPKMQRQKKHYEEEEETVSESEEEEEIPKKKRGFGTQKQETMHEKMARLRSMRKKSKK